jgi:hypothetical protein
MTRSVAPVNGIDMGLSSMAARVRSSWKTPRSGVFLPEVSDGATYHATFGSDRCK